MYVCMYNLQLIYNDYLYFYSKLVGHDNALLFLGFCDNTSSIYYQVGNLPNREPRTVHKC